MTLVEFFIGTAAAADGAVKNGHPFDYPIWTYLWVIALSVAGGIVNFVGKIKNQQARPFNIAELLGECFISGFAGLLTFWMCESAGIAGNVSAVMVGIAGHMGSRAVFKMEVLFEAVWDRWFSHFFPTRRENVSRSDISSVESTRITRGTDRRDSSGGE